MSPTGSAVAEAPANKKARTPRKPAAAPKRTALPVDAPETRHLRTKPIVTEIDRLCNGAVLNEGLAPADLVSILDGDPAAPVHHPENPRQGDVGAIAELIRVNGFHGRILVQVATPEGERRHRIIAGNHRTKAARLRGYRALPVEWVICSDRDALRILLADNKASDDATNDPAALLELLKGFAGDDDLDGTGYAGDDLDELELLVNGAAPAPTVQDDEHDAEPPSVAKSVPGEVYQLGRHRVLCGSCTDPEAVARLFDGARAALTFTSPPYNVGPATAVHGNATAAVAGTKYIDGQGDDMPPAEYLGLLVEFTRLALAHSDAVIVNLQSLANNKRTLVEYLYAVRTHLADLAIWDKGDGAAPAMAANVMNSNFEFLFFLAPAEEATRAIPTADFRGTVRNIHRGPPMRGNEYAEVHAATMPLHLPTWALTTFNAPKGAVYEPFGGTGTTLIVAEQLGLTCYVMELSPRYVDVIRARYAKLAGRPDLAP